MSKDTRKLIADINKRINVLEQKTAENGYEDWDMVPDDICWFLENMIPKLQKIHDKIYDKARAYDRWEESLYD